MEQILESGLFTVNIPEIKNISETPRERNCSNRTEELTRVVLSILGGDDNSSDYIEAHSYPNNGPSGDIFSVLVFPRQLVIIF